MEALRDIDGVLTGHRIGHQISYDAAARQLFSRANSSISSSSICKRPAVSINNASWPPRSALTIARLTISTGS